MEKLSQALKEWAVAVDALLAGEQILLLRKGGIREDRGRFAVKAKRVLLFPTFEHQQATLLKPPYQSAVERYPAGYSTTVTFHGWADITHNLVLEGQHDGLALLPFHIWNERFVQERLAWKPGTPLQGLLLRSHRLAAPQTLPYQSAYGGCRSWIDLAESVSLAGSQPVLSDAAYEARVTDILAAVDAPATLVQ